MLRGFFKIYRKIDSWEWWSDPITLAVWIHILHRARYGTTPMNYKGDVIERGELIIGLHEFSEECGISVQNLRTALKHLESTKELTRKVTSKVTRKYHHYNVENYTFYQDFNLEGNKLENGLLTSNQQQKKKENKENKDICVYRDNYKYIYSNNARSEDKDRKITAVAPRENTHGYGKFGNVFLTSEEYQEVKETFEDSRQLINRVSYWLTENERKNHFAVVLKFADADNWRKIPREREMTAEEKQIDGLTMAEIEALQEGRFND